MSLTPIAEHSLTPPPTSSHNNIAGKLSYIIVTEDEVGVVSVQDLFQNKQFTSKLDFKGVSQCNFHAEPNVKRYTRFHVRSALKFMGCKGADSMKVSERVFRVFEKEYMLRHYNCLPSPPVRQANPTSPISSTITSSPSALASPSYPSSSTSTPSTPSLSSSSSSASSPSSSSISLSAAERHQHHHRRSYSSSSGPAAAAAQFSGFSSSHKDASNQDPLAVTISRNEFYTIVGHQLAIHEYNKPQYVADFPIACAAQDRKYSFTILLGGTSGCGKSTLSALLATRIGFSSVISTDNIRQLMRKFISRAEAPILWASTYHAGEILDGDSALSHKDRILKGYEAQNEMIFSKLDALISTYEARSESLIIEGVHLDTRLIMRLVRGHPTCIPFLMYISNEAKHRERFAIRSKYMTLDPHQNKYTKYFKNIRIINDHLCNGADVKLIPQIDNTNMDRSLATIHATIFNCLRRHVLNNEQYYNSEEDKMLVVHEEFEDIKHALWSSKGMLRVIRDYKKDKRDKEEAGGDGSRISDDESSDEHGEHDDDDDHGDEEAVVTRIIEPVEEGPADAGFNSDDEEEEETSGVTAVANVDVKGQGQDDDSGDSSEYSDYDKKKKNFMDFFSLGS
eukprot:TRINITY_DN8429_c0_g1_i1.p1 TRINITY_DN8429_c0_g1~~TRINITY_DN8429_c0_g1_i1.p1  ORF type:complete len:623 (+),score=151.95 TRINITY_DN8429_c0_g1_i1:101-1969(+)